jgi:outer membrane protein assembly factor BamB
MTRSHRFAAPLLSMVVALLGTGSVMAGSSSAGNGYWTMFMDGPAHNGVNRDETTLGPSNVGGLVLTHTYTDWEGIQAEEGDDAFVMGSIGAGLTVANGNKIRLSIFNLPSGSLRWSHVVFMGDPGPSTPTPVLSNGTVYVAIGDTAYAYNAMTGHLIWSRPEAGTLNQTTLAGGVVYFSNNQPTASVYALNATTGAVLWSAPLAGECCGLGAVSVVNGVAYVTAGKLLAFNATTGAHLYTSSVTTHAGTPAVSGGIVYLENVDTLQAFSASTGNRLWSKTTVAGDDESSLDPAVDGSTVIVSTPQYVIAFNATSGARLWTHDAGSQIDYAPPSIADGVVYVGSVEDGVQALSEATGAVLFSHAGECFGSPAVSQGAVYVGCGSVMEVFGL